MKAIAMMFALAATTLVLSGCCCYQDNCEPRPCCPRPCGESRPHCCPKPHVWDRCCCDPSNYDYN